MEDPIPYLGNLGRLHHDRYLRENSGLLASAERLVGATPASGSGAPTRRSRPFRDDRVTVECRDGLFCIVNIGGYDFALNGAARPRFGLPFARDPGVAVLGKPVGPFIEMAHGLSE